MELFRQQRPSRRSLQTQSLPTRTVQAIWDQDPMPFFSLKMTATKCSRDVKHLFRQGLQSMS